jgi:hypothetical protein
LNYACYKAILCDRAVYLLEMVRYLPLNPGRMRSAVDPWAYRWSSHGTYLAKIGLVGVNTTVALGELAKSVGHAASLLAIYRGRKGVRTPVGFL